MRWFITLMLIGLVAAGVFWLAAGDRVLTAVGVRPAEAPTSASPSLTSIDQYLQPEKILRLQVGPPEQPTLTLSRNADGTWSQPGNWPLRETEVAELISAITTLRTRFAVIPLPNTSAETLKTYGLDPSQKPIDVKVDVRTDAGSKGLTMRFGRPEVSADSAFVRPCYVRVDDLSEVVKLGPDIYPVLARSPEVYRRRQLFPDAERVKLTGAEPPPNPMQPAPPPQTGRVAIPGNLLGSLTVERTDAMGTGEKPTPTKYTLSRTAPNPEPRRDPDRNGGEPSISANRLAQSWVLDLPEGDKSTIRDRIDPVRLKGILTAIPDLWVESFVNKPEAATGLDKPSRTVTVTRTNGKAVVLLVGNVSRTVNRTEDRPPPPPFGAPPPPPKVTIEEYRYARLKDNDLVFEIRSDKLGDLFADPQELRDSALARYEAGDVTELTVAVKGKPPVKLVRKKGNKDAVRDDDRQDRWYVGDLLAESSKVTELLDQLSRLEAKGKNQLIDLPNPAKLKELDLEPPTVVTVVVQPKVAEGESALPARTITYQVGKDDVEKKKLAVRVAGWERVNLVDDAVAKLIDRPTLAYRGRRLFDTAELTLESVAVLKDGVASMTLAPRTRPAPEIGKVWAIKAPLTTDADETKAAQLTGDLSRLEVVEYIDDSPKPEDLEKKFGLTKPRFTINLTFTGPGAKPQQLQIGANREGKPEAYARLNGTGSVFTVSKTLVDSLDAGAVALLPLQLWATTTDRVTAVEVKRPQGNWETYKLTQAGAQWQLSGPFSATASFAEVQPLLAAAASLKAEKYESLTDDPKYGLDKPMLKLTISTKESKPGPAGQPPVESVTTRMLLIGNLTAPGAMTRYARLDGANSPAIFVIPDALAKEADKPALAWLDRTLLSVDPAQVNKVQITGTAPDQAVTLNKDDKGTWTAEGSAFTVDTPIVMALVGTAARPPVVRLAGYGPGVKWADYGLEPPALTLTLTVKGGDKPATHTLKLGKTEPNGERYVRIDDGPAVGVLAPRAGEMLARSKLDFADRTLLTFDPATLAGIVRVQGPETLELSQNGTNWDIVKPTKQKADRLGLEDLAEQLSRLRAVRVAAFNPPDLDKPYGLKTPAAKVTLKLTGTPPEQVLAIGNPVDPAKPNGDRFALIEGVKGGSTVGVLPAGLVRRLLGEPTTFRDRTLARFIDADKLTLVRGDRTVTFAKVNGTWKMTSPVAVDAEQADLDELVNALAGLRADELVADKPADLKRFGLDTPEAKWTVSSGDRDVLTLLIGAKEKDGPRVYARLDKGDLVALLDPTLSQRVLGEYRKRAIFPDVDASQLESLVITAGSGNFLLQKGPEGWKDPAKPAETFDPAKVTETLATLAGLKAERFVADKDAKLALYGLEKPSRVIVFAPKGGGAKTLHIGGPVGSSGGKQVYARLPDQPTVFILSEADTAKLTRDRAGYK